MTDLYSLIPKDRFITAKELTEQTGLAARTLRTYINALRKNPATLIITDPISRGYKRPSGIEEIDSYIAVCRRRIDEEQEKIDALRKARKALKNAEMEQLMFDF